jgi:hypothetical protein
MSPFRILLAVLAFALAAEAKAAFYLVGHPNDQDCTHSFAQAVAAANANPGRDTIFLGFDQANVAFDITDDLDILGGFSSCEASGQTGFRTTLIGNGVGSALFVDNGVDLRLYDVAITGGGSNTHPIGGGIWKNGSGVLELHNSELYDNRALNGGGLYVSGNGAMALLFPGTRIHDNVAQRGAGIFVDEASLRIDYTDVAIYLNHTTLGDSNSDRFGGGIYATGSATRSAEVSTTLLSWDGPGTPHPPVQGARIYLNSARDGGGIYANAYTTVTLLEATVADNVATRYGGGIFLWGASLQMLRRYSVAGMTPVCAGQFGCSALRHNQADWSGAALAMWNGANAHIAQTLVSENVARDSTLDSYTQSVLSNLNNRLVIEASVIAGNTCTQSVGACRTISSSLQNNHGVLVLRHVTMVDNAAPNNGFSAEISVHPSNIGDVEVRILSSIIEPGAGMGMVSANNPAIFVNDCLMAPGPFPPTSTRSLQRARPYRYAARASRDYRLGDADVGIDGCDNANIPPDTLLTLAPDLGDYGSNDDPKVVNRLGPSSTHDLGAFETTPLLSNGFD